MTEQNQTNRRLDQRMPLQGLELKIKQSGLSHKLQHYVTCRSVDISLNGLAFSTENLELKVPEKIDFILKIENHEIKGEGVTCNKRQDASGVLYGLMFLSVTPELSAVFEHTELSSVKIENLAKNLAEQLVHSLIQSDNPLDKIVLNKQQQLFDACRTYLIRLGEMNVRLTDIEPDKLLHPVQAVKIFRDPEHNILLRWHNKFTGQLEQITIVVECSLTSSAYIINGEIHFKTILEVLEFLGQKLKALIRFI